MPEKETPGPCLTQEHAGQSVILGSLLCPLGSMEQATAIVILGDTHERKPRTIAQQGSRRRGLPAGGGVFLLELYEATWKDQG